MEAGLPIGCAPNIHVSLVLLPEECAAFSDRPYRWRRARLAIIKRVVAARFTRSLGHPSTKRRHHSSKHISANTE